MVCVVKIRSIDGLGTLASFLKTQATRDLFRAESESGPNKDGPGGKCTSEENRIIVHSDVNGLSPNIIGRRQIYCKRREKRNAEK